MHDRTLTFSETIQALECCIEPGTRACSYCPLTDTGACMTILQKEAKRQLIETRQELERLKGAKK